MSKPNLSTIIFLQGSNALPSSLEHTANDPHWVVRMMVAMHQNVNAKTLAVLALDANKAVVAAALRNKNCPASTLVAMADIKSVKIRQLVAEHPATPVAVLEVLATDKKWEVRSGVARNTSTPLELVEALTEDKCFPVMFFAHQARDNRLGVETVVAVFDSSAGGQAAVAGIHAQLEALND